MSSRFHPTRRHFLAAGGRAALGAGLVPRDVWFGNPAGRLSRAANDRLELAIVGAGGMGTENAQELGSEQIVAVCDVDFGLVEKKVIERTVDPDGEPRPQGLRWQAQFATARRYNDFREMLARESDLDGVVVATPDHTHAVIAAAAMRAGKHVYVQKPLAWSVAEARALARIAAETGVVTQMGNQGHSSDEARRVNEWIQAGVIGAVREVHAWTNRPIWPQGLPRPTAAPLEPGNPNWYQQWDRGRVQAALASALGGERPVPSELAWDLYLGPVAEWVAYHPIYHPFNWRGWVPFGVGALGDMGAHLLDHPYWALELGYPDWVEATSTPWGGGSESPVTYPLAMTARYGFPARGDRAPVTLTWYDGGLMPARPDALPPDVELNRSGGVLYVGSRGLLMHETYGENPTLYPESVARDAAEVPERYPRIEETHEMNWVLACKGEATATSPFSYAAPLTEVMLLGLVALRAGQGVRIEYDGEAGRVTRPESANRFLQREMRPGWAL